MVCAVNECAVLCCSATTTACWEHLSAGAHVSIPQVYLVLQQITASSCYRIYEDSNSYPAIFHLGGKTISEEAN